MAKGVAERLLERGANAVGRAAGAMLSDPRGQEVLARAVGMAQRGLRLVESAQERALHAAGLAARPDYDELRKQVARLKRKARDLSAQLAPQARSGDGGGDDGGGNAPPEEGGSR